SRERWTGSWSLICLRWTPATRRRSPAGRWCSCAAWRRPAPRSGRRTTTRSRSACTSTTRRCSTWCAPSAATSRTTRCRSCACAAARDSPRSPRARSRLRCRRCRPTASSTCSSSRTRRAATPRCARRCSATSTRKQRFELLARRGVAGVVVGIFGEVEEQIAGGRLGRKLEAFDRQRRGYEAMDAHARHRRLVLPAAAHVSHEVEHARVIEVHADHDQVESGLRQLALRFGQRARERQLVSVEDLGQAAVAFRGVGDQDALAHVGVAVTARSSYGPRVLSLYPPHSPNCALFPAQR